MVDLDIITVVQHTLQIDALARIRVLAELFTVEPHLLKIGAAHVGVIRKTVKRNEVFFRLLVTVLIGLIRRRDNRLLMLRALALLGGNKLESSTSDSCPGEALQLDLFCCRLMLNHAGRNGIIIFYLSVSIEMETEHVENERNITVVDLFAGCGGMSLGFEKAGVNVVAAYDNWDAAIDVYRANFQHPVFKRDLSDVSVSEEVAGFAPDIIIGGPPCQDFSQAGKRSEDGGRAILSVRYAEIIARCKPRFIVMENVPRVRTSKSMEAIRATLKAQGYGLSGRVMDASLCGVPQARKRYFLVGCLGAPDGFLDPYLEKGLSDHQMTIREYLGNELGIDYYFRIPRSYTRRAIFSIDEPSVTIRGVDRPIPPNYKLHPNDAADLSQARCLTPKERSRIQTFPESFKFFGSKTDINQMVGNAVPVNLATYVARALLEYRRDVSDGLR